MISPIFFWGLFAICCFFSGAHEIASLSFHGFWGDFTDFLLAIDGNFLVLLMIWVYPRLVNAGVACCAHTAQGLTANRWTVSVPNNIGDLRKAP
jgi:hypothetical protein